MGTGYRCHVPASSDAWSVPAHPIPLVRRSMVSTVTRCSCAVRRGGSGGRCPALEAPAVAPRTNQAASAHGLANRAARGRARSAVAACADGVCEDSGASRGETRSAVALCESGVREKERLPPRELDDLQPIRLRETVTSARNNGSQGRSSNEFEWAQPSRRSARTATNRPSCQPTSTRAPSHAPTHPEMTSLRHCSHLSQNQPVRESTTSKAAGSSRSVSRLWNRDSATDPCARVGGFLEPLRLRLSDPAPGVTPVLRA